MRAHIVYINYTQKLRISNILNFLCSVYGSDSKGPNTRLLLWQESPRFQVPLTRIDQAIYVSHRKDPETIGVCIHVRRKAQIPCVSDRKGSNIVCFWQQWSRHHVNMTDWNFRQRVCALLSLKFTQWTPGCMGCLVVNHSLSESHV